MTYFTEFAAERLALRTPAEIATDLIPDRPQICRFPGIKHFFIFKEWMETGIKPGCMFNKLVDRDDFTELTRVAGKLQEELCDRIPESEKKNLRIALGLEHDEVTPR